MAFLSWWAKNIKYLMYAQAPTYLSWVVKSTTSWLLGFLLGNREGVAPKLCLYCSSRNACMRHTAQGWAVDEVALCAMISTGLTEGWLSRGLASLL